MSKDKFGYSDHDAPIEYLEVGEREDMLGGPATEAGWFLHPECMRGCCASEGPFPTREAALEVDRMRWDRIARNSQSRSKVKGGTKPIEPF